MWWFVDGDPVDAGAGGHGWWTPKPGTHEVRVIGDDGSVLGGLRVADRKEEHVGVGVANVRLAALTSRGAASRNAVNEAPA